MPVQEKHTSSDRVKVFICYSSEENMELIVDNEEITQRLFKLFKNHFRSTGDAVDFWDFKKEIKGGDRYKLKTTDQINHTDIAIPIITQYFFASQFIQKTELPLILEKESRGELWILPIYVGPILERSWYDSSLKKFQCVPREPGNSSASLLDTMNNPGQYERDKIKILEALIRLVGLALDKKINDKKIVAENGTLQKNGFRRSGGRKRFEAGLLYGVTRKIPDEVRKKRVNTPLLKGTDKGRGGKQWHHSPWSRFIGIALSISIIIAAIIIVKALASTEGPPIPASRDNITIQQRGIVYLASNKKNSLNLPAPGDALKPDSLLEIDNSNQSRNPNSPITGQIPCRVPKDGSRRLLKKQSTVSVLSKSKVTDLSVPPPPGGAPKPDSISTLPLTRGTMVRINGGTFMMGSKDGDVNESPVHKVTLDAFYMDSTEVTQAHYEKVMGRNPSSKKCPTCPVENVTWNDAREYCKRVGKRLPTEAEWEYAARAGNELKHYLKNETIDQYVWYGKNAGGKTHTVATKNPNNFHLYDMAGNVWEWCYDEYYSYSVDSSYNPRYTGGFGACHIIRGGAWNSDTTELSAMIRWKRNSNDRSNFVGFRCACSIK